MFLTGDRALLHSSPLKTQKCPGVSYSHFRCVGGSAVMDGETHARDTKVCLADRGLTDV